MFDEQKPDEQHLAPELVAFERQLLGLTPAIPRIDRDRLMFEAGRAASARPGWSGYIAGPSWAASRFWPAATVMMTAASLLLATMLVWQNRSQSVAGSTAKPQALVETVSNPRDTDVDQAARYAVRDNWSTIPSTSNGYLGVRHVALTRGVGALSPEFEASYGERDMPLKNRQSKPATARGLLDELLPTSTRSNPTRS